jgi:DNA-binding MarR family transcriptional regulator
MRILILSAAACSALLFASPLFAQGAPEKPKVHIAVGGKAALYYLPLTIAEQLGLTLPSVSKLVDGLVKQKLIIRKESTTDRRKLTLALTHAGASIVDSARSGARANLAKKLGALSNNELGTILKAMQLLRPIFVQGGQSL